MRQNTQGETVLHGFSELLWKNNVKNKTELNAEGFLQMVLLEHFRATTVTKIRLKKVNEITTSTFFLNLY